MSRPTSYSILSSFLAIVPYFTLRSLSQELTETYEKLKPRLDLITSFDSDDSQFNFHRYNKPENLEKDLNRSSPPEICEWGAVEDLSIPQRFCTLAAIKMYNMAETKPSALQSSLHADSKLVPYTVCYRLKLEKMNNTLTNAIFCPPSTVQISEHERIHLDGFFLGRGDEDFNSVFTFGQADPLGNRVNVLHYINSLMHSDVLKITEEESSNASLNKSLGLRIFKSEEAAWRFLSCNYLLRYVFGHVPPKNSVFCNLSIRRKQDLCKYFATMKFIDHTGQNGKIRNLKSTNYVDTTGFVPYRCVNRRIGNYASNSNICTRALIYCPNQIFTINGHLYGQRGFFFSNGDKNTNSALLYNIRFEIISGQRILKSIHNNYHVTWKQIDLSKL